MAGQQPMQKAVWSNSGRAFKNSDKRSDKSPDMKGDAKITCPLCGEEHDHYVSVWNKVGARGPWLAFTYKPRQAREEQQQEQAPQEPEPEQQSTTAQDDSSMPF